MQSLLEKVGKGEVCTWSALKEGLILQTSMGKTV